MIEDGWRLVRDGVTTPSEVLRVSKEEDGSLTPDTLKRHGRSFEYKALQATARIKLGQVDAGGRQDAMQMIEALGLTPLRMTEKRARRRDRPLRKGARKLPAAGSSSFKSNRVSFEALEDFTRSLSSLLTAGVPLSRALTILYKEMSHPAASAKWKELHDLVIDGVSLAEAMSRSPETFPRVYVAMVEAGEAGGFLDVVLAQIADFQAREKELRAQGDGGDDVSGGAALPGQLAW